MLKSVLARPEGQRAASGNPAEMTRSQGIHLVTVTRVASPASAVPAIPVPDVSPRKSRYTREIGTMNTLALAGAALIPPVIWMGHALLVWLDIL